MVLWLRRRRRRLRTWQILKTSKYTYLASGSRFQITHMSNYIAIRWAQESGTGSASSVALQNFERGWVIRERLFYPGRRWSAFGPNWCPDLLFSGRFSFQREKLPLMKFEASSINVVILINCDENIFGKARMFLFTLDIEFWNIESLGFPTTYVYLKVLAFYKKWNNLKFWYSDWEMWSNEN